MGYPRTLPILAFAWAVFGQAPSDLFEKAPPSVDEALRARVTKFYQAHVDGKFRAADQMVAEDSKDAFFAADKTRYKACEIVKIAYSDQFTRARVVTACDSEFVTMMGRIPVKLPLTTPWKLENGEWFWYIEPRSGGVDTPFGKMEAGPDGNRSPFPAKMPDAAAIMKQVKVDRTEVRLSSFEPASAEVTVSNHMPGSISLSLSFNGFPGFKARLDRTSLASGQSARILLECKPEDQRPKPTLTLQLTVEPTDQVIPIRVLFAVPPEIEKQLPR
ncbi:MAG: hypothetical protein Q8N47_09730 [Bryobacterales bacterium]|nr:hypothetical protein [Bryobacterales bacterium]